MSHFKNFKIIMFQATLTQNRVYKYKKPKKNVIKSI